MKLLNSILVGIQVAKLYWQCSPDGDGITGSIQPFGIPRLFITVTKGREAWRYHEMMRRFFIEAEPTSAREKE